MAASKRKYKDGIYRDSNGRLMEHKGKSVKIYWTGAMLDYLKANYATTTNAELSEYFGISQRVINKKASEIGLKKDSNWLKNTCKANAAIATTHNRVYGNRGMFTKDHYTDKRFQTGHECKREWEEKRLAGLMKLYQNPAWAKAKAKKGWETRRRNQMLAKLKAKEVAV